jgi:hypothetical protein
MPPSNTSSCYQEAGLLDHVPVGEQDDKSQTCTARLRPRTPRTSVSHQNETREESQLPPRESVEASNNQTRSGLNEAKKRKKSECLDVVDQANPCKRARTWRGGPISTQASRLYNQGGPGWVEAYEIEFRTVIKGSIGIWERERARGGTRAFQGEDYDVSCPDLFAKYASDRRLLEAIAAESRTPNSQRPREKCPVLRWGEPAFMEKQCQILQEQTFVLQKVFQRVQGFPQLKHLNFVKLDWCINQAIRFIESPSFFYDLSHMRTAWDGINEQAKDVVLGYWDREVFQRLKRSIFALDDELWLWKLIHDEKSGEADKVSAYVDKLDLI